MSEALDLDTVVSAALATDEIRAALADQRLGLTEDDLRAHAEAHRLKPTTGTTACCRCCAS